MPGTSPEQLREHLLDSEATLRQVEQALRDFDGGRTVARPAWILIRERRRKIDSR